MTHLEYYDQLIKSGEIVAGYWIAKEVDNLVREMSDERFVYDTTEADKRIKFMQTLS